MITGGSSGIGLTAAKALIEAGAYVVATGRRQTELDRAKQLLGKNATAVLDSADKCDCKEAKMSRNDELVAVVTAGSSR